MRLKTTRGVITDKGDRIPSDAGSHYIRISPWLDKEGDIPLPNWGEKIKDGVVLVGGDTVAAITDVVRSEISLQFLMTLSTLILEKTTSHDAAAFVTCWLRAVAEAAQASRLKGYLDRESRRPKFEPD
ncbi:hypothetical protein Clacol_006922 [Clathrus columnatus]|uniref:Uncharacterized protein n=1 Tax=Clathrus columnatus TaxID=1419009 RepID=A0AAV5AGP9_9AGAM|nr:hypothetical protein Clacol_006922 [Clathrus columnatus]